MKKTIFPLFILPLFLASCNSSRWYSVDQAKAREIANNIIEYNKQNRPRHLIKNTEEYATDPSGKLSRDRKTYAAYDIDRGYYQIGIIDFFGKKDIITVTTTIYYVDDSMITSLVYDNGEMHQGEIYYAKDNKEAKKIFVENIIDVEMNPCLEITNLFEIENNYHRVGEKLRNPSIDGHAEALTKDNRSLDINSNYYSPISVSVEGVYVGNWSKSILFENNRCLKYKSTITTPSSKKGAMEQHITITYDYDTPVKSDIGIN